MKYYKEIILKNGKTAILRNADENDGKDVLEIFIKTHEETDYLLTYPDEITFTAEQEADFLKNKTESEREVEIAAVIDGKIVGTAGIDPIGRYYKLRHRAEMGIGILKDYCGCGIGKALTEACIECAKKAEYTQIELTVVAENGRAVNMYKKLGFTEYGRNPKGFNSRISGYTEIIEMRLEL